MSINKDGKRLAVVGSRDFDDKVKLYEVLTKNFPRIKLIVSGGARGADTLGVEWANDFGVPYLVFPAAWHDPFTGEYDKGAGFRRNRDIVEHCDVVMAFWDGISGGTKNTIDMAREAGLPVKIILFEKRPVETPIEQVDFKRTVHTQEQKELEKAVVLNSCADLLEDVKEGTFVLSGPPTTPPELPENGRFVSAAESLIADPLPTTFVAEPKKVSQPVRSGDSYDNEIL